MSDYIDRKRAANFICKIICGNDRGLCVSTPENCQQKRMMAFFELPAADIVPVVHGKWVEKPFLLGTTNECSNCNDFFGMPHGKFNYCPNCGAKMDLEEQGKE